MENSASLQQRIAAAEVQLLVSVVQFGADRISQQQAEDVGAGIFYEISNKMIDLRFLTVQV